MLHWPSPDPPHGSADELHIPEEWSASLALSARRRALSDWLRSIGDGESDKSPLVLFAPSPRAARRMAGVHLRQHPESGSFAWHPCFSLNFPAPELWSTPALTMRLVEEQHANIWITAACLRPSSSSSSQPVSRDRRPDPSPTRFGALRQCSWIWIDAAATIAIASLPPVTVRTDAAGRLHAIDGPAILYADGSRAYYLHGVPAPNDAFEQTHLLPPEDLIAGHPPGIREVYLRQLGIDGFLARIGAREVARDMFGKLYRAEAILAPDTPPDLAKASGGRTTYSFDSPEGLIQFESTLWLRLRGLQAKDQPEADNPEHLLLVPGFLETPRAAVAWTFNLAAWEYEPMAES